MQIHSSLRHMIHLAGNIAASNSILLRSVITLLTHAISNNSAGKMSGIPVYTQSPTRAPNAAGTTPMTSSPQGLEALQRPHNNYAPTTKSTPTSTSSYPEAQPGAAAVPAPTGAVVPPYPSTTQYTPTRTTDTRNYGPPAPQPGASPVPYNTPGLNYELPPPPKAGEVHHTPSPHHQYPYQLDYEMGSNAYTARPPAAVNTTTTTPSQSYPIALPMGQSEPINSDDEAQRNSFENPPGSQSPPPFRLSFLPLLS
jgi:hypothetical protein